MLGVYAPYHDHVYGAYVQNTLKNSTYESGGTITTEANTCYLVGDSATFITDGVAIGDLVTVESGETAEVLAVDSETKIFTTVLSDSGVYTGGDDFSITRDGTAISSGIIDTADPMTYMVIDDGAAFLTDGVMKGDTVTMTIGGGTATVVKVFSETRLSTTALSASGTYDTDEAFTIDDGDIYRAVIYVGETHKHVLRQIIGITDATAGHVRIYKDWNASGPIFEVAFPTSVIFAFNPETGVTDGAPIIVEVDIDTEGASNLNLSWEYR